VRGRARVLWGRVNLFSAGHGATAVDVGVARRALAGLIAELGFFDPQRIETWRSPSGRVAITACANEAAVEYYARAYAMSARLGDAGEEADGAEPERDSR